MKKKSKRSLPQEVSASLFPDRFTVKDIKLITTQSQRFNDHNQMPAQTEIEFKLTAKQDKKNKVLSLIYTAKLSMYSDEAHAPDEPFFISMCAYHVLCVPTKKTFPRMSDKEIEKGAASYISEKVWPYIREHLSLTMAQLKAPLLSLPTNWDSIQSSFK